VSPHTAGRPSRKSSGVRLNTSGWSRFESPARQSLILVDGYEAQARLW